jgi:hypothetical protein
MLYMVTFTINNHQYTPNVSIYTIHGSYGYNYLSWAAYLEETWMRLYHNPFSFELLAAWTRSPVDHHLELELPSGKLT